MRKIILFISVLSLALLLSNCTNKSSKSIDDSKIAVEIPDANFKAFLMENFDTDKDGKISLAEAMAVTEINCSNRNIKDLTGIEKFENLVKLNCSNNQLDELELSYNKKIDWLNCSGNVDGMYVYFAMSSPISNKNFVLPENKADFTPEEAVALGNPIDVNKCVFDWNKTNFVINFNM